MTVSTQQQTEAPWGIVESSDEAYWVNTPDGGCLARPAASCLMQPERGDKVLLSLPAGGVVYILAVLERGTGDAVLSLPERTSLRAPALQIEAHELHLRSRSATIEANSLAMHAREAETVADTVRQHARAVYRRTDELEEVHAGRMRIVVDTIHSIRCTLGRWIAKTLAKVDGDQVHLG